MKLKERLLSYVAEDPQTGCWNWTGYCTRTGYGRIKVGQRSLLAARVAYEQFTGPIPQGLTVDHLCRNTGCVNPGHLECVDAAENTRRARAAITHCPKGHPYDEQNTLVWADGKRRCRICQREHSRRSYDKWRQDHLAERAAYLREWRRNNPDKVAEYNRRRRAD